MLSGAYARCRPGVEIETGVGTEKDRSRHKLFAHSLYNFVRSFRSFGLFFRSLRDLIQDFFRSSACSVDEFVLGSHSFPRSFTLRDLIRVFFRSSACSVDEFVLGSHSFPRSFISLFPQLSPFLPTFHLFFGVFLRSSPPVLRERCCLHLRVEDIPGLAFLSLNKSETASPSNVNLYDPSPASPPTRISSTESESQMPPPRPGSPCPARPPGVGRPVCTGEGLGDAWGGGVGGGWATGLGVWRGLRGSLVGAREFLGHLKAYLGFYHREEAVMYAPLVEVRVRRHLWWYPVLVEL